MSSPHNISLTRLYILRAFYLLIAVGLSMTVLPGMLTHPGGAATPDTVVSSILAGFVVLSLLGLYQPIAMIPILLLELVWKSVWLVTFAIPAWRQGMMDTYTEGIVFATGLGVVLTPAVLPWKYIGSRYFTQGDRWRS